MNDTTCDECGGPCAECDCVESPMPEEVESVQQSPASGSISAQSCSNRPALLQLQRSDPQAFSRTSVSISAAYGDDDGRTEWQVVNEEDGYVHIEMYELRYIGAPFNHDSRIQVLSLMVTRGQATALLGELVAKLSPVECGEQSGEGR